MSANTRVVLILVLLLAGVGLIAYFATQDPAPMPTGPEERDESDEIVEIPPAPLGRPGALTGVVRVFKTEEPAEGIEVRIEGAGEPITRKTNSRGIFVASVRSGREVTVTAFAPEPYADVVVRGVTVKPGATTSVGTLYLERALVVKGIVVDRAGKPVTGADVSAYRPVIGDSPAADFLEAFTSMTKPRSPMDTGVTGDDGRFTLRELSPGTYRIEARADGFAVGSVRNATVSPESVRVEHRIVLGPGFELAGEVTTSAGLPVPEALVSVIRTDSGPGVFDFSPVQTRTNDEGLFAFENLSPGRASLAVRAEGYPTKMVNQVSVGQKQPLTVVLGGTASIRGRVTSKSGDPIDGASITIAIGQRGGAFGETMTDTDGRYFMENLPEGRIQFMRVEAAGFASWPVIDNPMQFQRGFGELAGEKSLVKDIEMSSGSRVFGTVTSKADGQPIGGASVYLMGGFSAFLGASGETVTDEDGVYEITGVAKGMHQLVVKAPGFYQTGLDPQFMQRAFGFGMGGKAPEGAPEVTIADGGPDQRLDIALMTGATAIGTVVTPDNQPVPGARVTIVAKPNPGGVFLTGGRPTAGGPTAITDKNGNFRVIGLEAGEAVKFEAEADEWVKGESEPVALASGRETAGIVVQLRRGGFITGTITSYKGGPLAGAEIRTIAQPENATGNPWQWEWQLRSVEPTMTDAQGRYRIANLTPGPWILRVEAPGHRIVTKLDNSVPEGADGGPVDLKLEQGLQITGVIIDEAGTPIPDVNLWTNVTAVAGGRGRGNSSIRNATSDADGAFVLDQLEPGTYSITVQVAGYANRSLTDIAAGTANLRVVLEKGLTISGRVLLPDGTPGENVWVSAQNADGNSSNDRTDADGKFEIENLPKGTYTVRTNSGGAFRFMGGKDEGPSLMPSIQEGVPAGTSNLELRLRAGAVIEGRVTDENGNPIQGASVWARSLAEGETSSGWNQTDENGEFRVTGLAPGIRVSVTVSHGDYGPLSSQEVNADSTSLSFVLPPKPVQPEGAEPTEIPTPR